MGLDKVRDINWMDHGLKRRKVKSGCVIYLGDIKLETVEDIDGLIERMRKVCVSAVVDNLVVSKKNVIR